MVEESTLPDPEAFYDASGADEWERLERGLDGRLEFEYTTGILEERLPSSGRVVDVGGGAGRYAVWLAERLRTERGSGDGVLAVPLCRTCHDRVAPLRKAYRSLERLPTERQSIVRDRVETLLAGLDLAAVIDERPSQSLAALRELDGAE